MAKTKDFFVSYNKADRFWAAGIREWLLAAGKTVVMQDPDFQPGSNFVIEMHEALKSAKRMLSVLSQDYLESRFCSSEWAAKFAEDPTGADRLLLMVKVRDCKLEGLLKQIVYLDLTGLTIEAAETRFLAAIAERSGPPTKPEAPGREKKPEKANELRKAIRSSSKSRPGITRSILAFRTSTRHDTLSAMRSNRGPNTLPPLSALLSMIV